MSTDGTGFEELLRRAQGGDHGAMEELLVLVRPHLERVATRYVDARDAAETISDLVQESWVLAWNRLHQFGGARSDDDSWAMFLAWAARIVRNVGLQGQRSKQRLKRRAPGNRVPLRTAGSESTLAGAVEPSSPGPTASSILRGEEQASRVRQALDAVEDAVIREVVSLVFFEGMSYREISEALDLTYDQVRDRFHRGMYRIGELLNR